MKFRIALLLTQIKDLFRRIFGSLSPGEDPYAAVRVPTRRGPSGRSSAIAVMEPGDDGP
jgi:hypothetical protein